MICSPIYAQNLSINSQEVDRELIFEYVFYFDNETKEDVIAFEKPKDAQIISAKYNTQSNLSGNVNINSVGDFFRFEIDSDNVENISIIFSSKELHTNIFEENELKFYVNTNIELTEINLQLDPIRDFSEITDVFPREYNYNFEQSVIEIKQIGSLKDNLFEIRYMREEQTISPWLLGLLFVPILFFILLFFLLRVNPSKKRDKSLNEFIEDDDESSKEDSSQNNKKIKKTITKDIEGELDDIDSLDEELETEIEIIEEDINNDNNSIAKTRKEKEKKQYSEETVQDKKKKEENTVLKNTSDVADVIEEYIQKYLTENEQDVIRIIASHEGIIQQEILDNLPIITKSTLSKIVTKLEGKRIIDRIRVGKINKLYLGEKLTQLLDTDTKKEEEEKNKEEKKK